jgi:diguanylate cyclase (GGDEF)-like protein
VSLRTRIALTFLLLLAGVLAAAFMAVSAANRSNAEREVNRQLTVGHQVFERALESNRRQLVQAAQVLAADWGFREAMGSRDSSTLGSALQNHASRIGASLATLVSLEGRVLAASGTAALVGERYRHAALLDDADDSGRVTTITFEDGRIVELVMVPVRAPLPVAWIVMGFALDQKAVRELSAVTGLDVTLAVREPDGWSAPASTLAPAALGVALRSLAHPDRPGDGDLVGRSLPLSAVGAAPVTALLTRSLTDARRPFDRLSDRLLLIAVASLALTAFAVFWLSRNITRPLHALGAVVEQMRGGRYDADVRIERRDEIGLLAEGLQLMGRAVQARDSDIRRLAYTDRLTGLMNRTAFAESLAVALASAPGAHAVALINVRRFRRINECLGYAVGDEVLRQIGARLKDHPPLGTAVARIAGDHFAVLSPLADETTLASFGTRILERLSAPVTISAQSIDVTTAVGLASAPTDSNDADDLMRCADLALDRARRQNAMLQMYTSGLRVAARDQLSLLGELDRAIAQDELVLAFQPKLSLADGTVRGAEALIRWQHPGRGLLPPASFIPFAEQTGFIRRITRWAIARGTRTAAAWARAGAPVPLSINISADDLSDPDLPDYVRRAVEESGLAADLLTLELTESGFIADPDRALARLEALRVLGVKLSIDDFGTGYSSLSYLARMPVDELKIDRSFVIAISEREEVAAIVRAAAEMAHSLGLTVVAEGIEDVETAVKLAALGCDLGQGYLYAKPLLEPDFLRWRAARAPLPSATAIVRSLATVQRRA